MTVQLEQVAQWLLVSGRQYRTLRTVTEELAARLCAAGLPVQRFNLGVFAHHPVMAGYAVLWDETDPTAIEIPVRREDMLKKLYLESPIRLLAEGETSVNFDLADESACEKYPVLSEFRNEGFANYIGFSIPFGNVGTAVLTLCTKRPGGFSLEQYEGIRCLFPVLRLLIDLVESRRLAKTVMRTYLGRHTAQLVLDGKIQRGQGEVIEAAIWLCDLRDFSSMTAAIGSLAMIEVMNDYFDCMAEAVWEHQGDILKFMGDAMLVVFRVSSEVSLAQAAERAASAAVDAQHRLGRLSERRLERGEQPLRTGIAVHLGKVIYGNIGAATRLDFTVMGHAVNLVARIQELTRDLDEGVLFSGSVAAHLEHPVVSLSTYEFKGIGEPVEIYKLGSEKT
jgi:adenylate cyclase